MVYVVSRNILISRRLFMGVFKMVVLRYRSVSGQAVLAYLTCLGGFGNFHQLTVFAIIDITINRDI
ncbi:MAG: hypothetical protein ACJAUL_001746 [Paraglaciecola sp.]|jgi:hypothetical protein